MPRRCACALPVAIAHHAVVAELGVSAVAELFAHLVAQMHELVVYRVKLSAVLLIPPTLRLPCGKAALVVRAGLERRELRQSVSSAFKRYLRGREELFVLLNEFVLALKLGDYLGRECLEAYLGIHEHEIAVFSREIFAERCCKHSPGPLLHILLKLGHCSVPEILFLIVELIPRIHGMTYGNEVYKGVDMFFELLLLEEYLFGIRVAFRRSKALGEAVEAFLSFIDIGSGIGHFAKFHIGPPFDRPNMSHPRKAHRERLMPSGVIRLFPVLSGSRNGAGSVCAAPFGKVRPNHARLFEAPSRPHRNALQKAYPRTERAFANRSGNILHIFLLLLYSIYAQ